jgi:uncharacterized protein DUF6281
VRFIAAALLTVLVPALLVVGCSAETGDEGEGDCARGVLFNEGEYVERGFVDQAGKVIGSGSYATCDDTSEDAQGLEFRDDGEKVEVWSIPDVPRHDAVAVEVDGSYAVLLNEEMSEPRRAAIIAELELDG